MIWAPSILRVFLSNLRSSAGDGRGAADYSTQRRAPEVRRRRRGSGWIGFALLVALGACDSRRDAPLRELPEHRLAFGGDVFLGRALNSSLFAGASRRRIFEGLLPVLSRADLILVNAEGVISGGGAFVDKGQPQPHAYRAHPSAVQVLGHAGVDVVAIGNNHSGDYGPAALGEMLDRLRVAGIDYTGGGRDATDARTPAFRRVGDAVVAFVGADLTGTCAYRAGRARPGTLCFDGFDEETHDGIARELGRIARAAHRWAHVVILTPHWGSNKRSRPTTAMRELAARLIRSGFDAILGHSAHWLQGVGLVDGKPIVYDAGNLVVDYPGEGQGHRGILYEVTFRRDGISKLRARPITLARSRTTLATGRDAARTLGELVRLSNELGTRVRLDGNSAVIRCDPGPQERPARSDVPERPLPPAVRLAPSDTLLDGLPPSATPANVRYTEGITLVGAELQLRELPVPRAANIVSTYWRASRRIERSYVIHVEARGRAGSSIVRHLPGDWLLPTNQWPVGKVIRDRILQNVYLPASGSVEFFVGLRDRELLRPAEADRRLVDGALYPMGTARFVMGAPGLFAQDTGMTQP
ncbi:MAG: CapA family protein [Deltaproteobacteria bacterium]|nr:CapA family protein [Deltaproteobacteria bacterium]